MALLREAGQRMSKDGLGFRKAEQLGIEDAATWRAAHGQLQGGMSCRRIGIDYLTEGGRRPILWGPRVCVIVRVFKPALAMTYGLVYSLLSSLYANLDISLVDSFPTSNENSAARELADLVQNINDCRVRVAPVNDELDWSKSIFACLASGPEALFKSVFGYDVAEAELQRLLYRNKALDARSSGFCHYFMLTNNDNLYSSNLFAAALDAMRETPPAPFIHVRFTSHHVGYRERSDDGIDLGAALMHHSLFAAGEPVFMSPVVLADAMAFWNADRNWFERLLVSGVPFRKLDKVLFIHQ